MKLPAKHWWGSEMLEDENTSAAGSLAAAVPAAPAGDEKPAVDPARKALVAEWLERVQNGEKYHEAAFKRMREDMDLARFGAQKEYVDAGSYVAPIVRRHLNQAVASLYAKNPTAYGKVRDRLLTKVWDGSAEALAVAMQNPIAPMSQQVLVEAEQARQQMQVMKALSKTLEILFNYYVSEQAANFKKQLKQLVRRTKTCGVGYLKLGFQRLLEPNPEIMAEISDATSELNRLEALARDVSKGEVDEDSARKEELRTLLKSLQGKETVIAREGLVFDFPRATEIIVDPQCRQLAGFIGAEWVAHKYLRTPQKIKELYGVDIGTGYLPYQVSDARKFGPNVGGDKSEKANGVACVYEVQHKANGQVFTICDGYEDFLREPAAPDVEHDGFWSLFVLTFNDIEHEDEVYPPSDVRDLRHIQLEYNRAGQGLREHRIANRPAFATGAGMLSEQDKVKIENRPAFALLELQALAGTDKKVEDLLQAVKGAPIDPALYDKEVLFTDMLRSVGGQEANIGGLSGATATESSIADASLSKQQSSDIDEIDEFLGDVAKAAGQIMLLNLSAETVQEIVGPGAQWPEQTREQVAKDLWLELKAGSTGRPNTAAEIAKRERAMPTILQLGGVKAEPIAEDYLELLGIDTKKAVVEGLPSIVAQNAMAGKQAQVATGDASRDPQAQGGQGGNNTEQPRGEEPGGQPAYPSGPQGFA